MGGGIIQMNLLSTQKEEQTLNSFLNPMFSDLGSLQTMGEWWGETVQAQKAWDGIVTL